jgi:hypothetical protein
MTKGPHSKSPPKHTQTQKKKVQEFSTSPQFDSCFPKPQPITHTYPQNPYRQPTHTNFPTKKDHFVDPKTFLQDLQNILQEKDSQKDTERSYWDLEKSD